MADRNFCKEIGSLERGMVFMSGVLAIASDASVTSESLLGASVAKTGTGEYTITLEDSYVSLLSCNLTLEAATAVDLVPQIKSVDVVSAKTIVIRLLAVATATNPSAACKLHIALKLKNSTV
jgi:hypothetical protein